MSSCKYKVLSAQNTAMWPICKSDLSTAAPKELDLPDYREDSNELIPIKGSIQYPELISLKLTVFSD